MASNSYRSDLIKRLRAEADAAALHLGGKKYDDVDIAVIAQGILVLAQLCNEAATELASTDATTVPVNKEKS